MDTTSSSRSEEWLEGEFRRHHRAVLAYARRRVPGPEADDVLAEVFAAAWRHRDRVPDDALPWLYRTALNHVMHVQRSAVRRGRLASRVAVFGGLQHSVPDHACREESRAGTDDDELVRALLSRLPPRDAEILRLDAWEQLTGDELAYVLGCSAAAARVRLHRARRRFAAAYDAEPVRAGDHDSDCEARR